MKRFRLSIVSILIIFIVSLVCIFNSSGYVYAPPFGRPYEPVRPYEPPTLAPPASKLPGIGEVSPSGQFGKDTMIPNKVLESSIKAEASVRHSDTAVVRTEKMNEIFHLLDERSQALNPSLRDGIWGDAYAFGNDVIKTALSQVVAKLLLDYFILII